MLSAGRNVKQSPVQEDHLEEQEMLEAAIEIVAEMQLTAEELKVCSMFLSSNDAIYDAPLCAEYLKHVQRAELMRCLDS